MKAFLTAWLSGALAVYLACTLVGYFTGLQLEQKLGEQAARDSLAFAFSDAEDWTGVRGGVSQGWLIRKAWTTGESQGRHYSEQVLKVGWPFTAARGFARIRAGETDTEGAILLQGDPKTSMVRFMPVQPVWPGIVINSLPLALLLLVGWRRSRI